MAHTFNNIGFEDPEPTSIDVVVGERDVDNTYIAAAWTPTEFSSAVNVAEFVSSVDGGSLNWSSPFEPFESGWSANEDAILEYDDPGSQLSAAQFNGPELLSLTDFDGFESKWSSNEGYLFALSALSLAEFGTALDNFDGFESEWSDNEDFAFDIGDTTQTAAQFDTTPESVEDFEEEWNNDSFAADIGDTTQSSASFDGASPESVEDFEEVDFNVYLVTILAAVNGDYDVEINGRSHVFTASSHTITQIRNALDNIINNSPEPVTSTTSGTDALKLKANVLPPAIVAGVTGPGPNNIEIVPIDSSLYWTQNEQAATI